MAKSAGNFYTLDTIIQKNIDPLAFRYLVLTAHYRSRLNFTKESLAAAEQSLARIQDFIRQIQGSRTSRRSRTSAVLKKYVQAFGTAIADDLNTPRALAVIWDMVGAYHKNPDQFNPAALRRLILDFDKILGLGLAAIKKETIPKKILALVEKREALRKQKDWQGADRIRDEIARLGWSIEDTPQGATTKRASPL